MPKTGDPGTGHPPGWRPWRHLGSLAVGAVGTLGVCALSLGMNTHVAPSAAEPVSVLVEAKLEAPKRRAAERKARSTTSTNANRAAPSAVPLLAAGLGGLDVGLPGAGDAAMAEATEAMLRNMGGAVMDEAQVEDAPSPVEQRSPDFPARARAQGLSGFVTLSFVVDLDGSVQDVHVLEAEPEGVFEDAALTAARSWRFEPGRHQGSPVAVRVRQTLRFGLE